jgi:hypothetical protein
VALSVTGKPIIAGNLVSPARPRPAAVKRASRVLMAVPWGWKTIRWTKWVHSRPNRKSLGHGFTPFQLGLCSMVRSAADVGVQPLAGQRHFGVATLARAWESQHNHRLATVATPASLKLVGSPQASLFRRYAAANERTLIFLHNRSRKIDSCPAAVKLGKPCGALLPGVKGSVRLFRCKGPYRSIR